MKTDIDAIIARIRERCPPLLRVPFRVGGVPLDLWTNSEDVQRELAAYYAPFQDGPGTDDRAGFRISILEGKADKIVERPARLRRARGGLGRIKEVIHDVPGGRIIEKVSSRLTVFAGEKEWVILGRAADGLHAAVNVVNAAYMRACHGRGLLILHAAAVAWEGRAVAIMGAPGAGKSTAALWCMEEGADYVTNDRLLVGPPPESAVLGVPKHPRINPGTRLTHPRLLARLAPEERRRLAALPMDELVRLEEKEDAAIEALYGPNRLRIPTRLAGWVFLEWRFGEAPLTASWAAFDVLRPWSGDILRALDPYDGPGGEIGLEEMFGRADACLSRIPGLRIAGGADFPRLARILRAWMGAGVPPEIVPTHVQLPLFSGDAR